MDGIGWPGRSLVGVEGAHTRLEATQHADRDRAFQRRCLELLRRAVDDGEASAADLAYLTDRVLLANGRRVSVLSTEMALASFTWITST